MFDPSNLLGIKEVKIDAAKKRFSLSAVKAEKNERILIVMSEDETYFKLYGMNYVKDILEKLRFKTINDKFTKEERNIIYSIVSEVSVGTESRIVIPKNLFEKLGFFDSAYIVGDIDHLSVFPNEIQANQYRKKMSE